MTRVVLADDSVLLRTGLRRLLTDEGFDVVGEAGDAAELLAVVARTSPDLALVDIRMPPTHQLEGLEATLTLRQIRPALAVLLLSQYVESRDVVTILRGRHAGIGYLLKDRVTNIDAFIADDRRVVGGGTADDPLDVELVLNRPRTTRNPLHALSPREAQILTLMAEGQSNAGIADTLFLAERTVEKHVAHIFNRLSLEPQADINRRVLAVLTLFKTDDRA
jgi:serine/threonine-protein kinase